MKVLALNSSPKMEKGGTALILNPFLEGLEEAGAEVELIYVHKLRVEPCLGDFGCWFKTPGKCIQEDDMTWLLPKLEAADLLVLATPVFVDGMSSTMKRLIERSLPLMEPFFEIRDGHCRHPRRDRTSSQRVVLVSVCGFTELDNFGPLLAHIEAICRNLGAEFAGALLRPYAAALPRLGRMGLSVDQVFKAAREAGRQLIRDGKMGEETLAEVSRELLPREEYLRGINALFQRALERLQNPRSRSR
ncbi:MAG: flavodoxin family protein [Candidatus Bipolaricaulia bacterium]